MKGSVRCFLCRDDVMPKDGFQLPRQDYLREGHDAERLCPVCKATMSDSVALVSVTDSSYNLQIRAVSMYYARKEEGVSTPFPNLIVRTGLSVFVVEDFLRGYYLRMLGLNEVVAVEKCVSALRKSGWDYFPDIFFEEEGIVDMIDEDIVKDWCVQRRIAKGG